jgi:hypothetical protein
MTTAQQVVSACCRNGQCLASTTRSEKETLHGLQNISTRFRPARWQTADRPISEGNTTYLERLIPLPKMILAVILAVCSSLVPNQTSHCKYDHLFHSVN